MNDELIGKCYKWRGRRHTVYYKILNNLTDEIGLLDYNAASVDIWDNDVSAFIDELKIYSGWLLVDKFIEISDDEFTAANNKALEIINSYVIK